MSKELFVSSTPHETKVAIVEEDQLAEIYFERENEYTLAGSIYKGRVTRVLPGMQSAFVNIGLERDAFLYVSDFLLEEEDADLDTVAEHPRGGREAEARAPEEAATAAPQEAATAEEIPGERAEAPPAPSEAGAGQESDREGPRRYRGRRRRRGGRQRFEEREERPAQPMEGARRAEERHAERPARPEYPPIVLPGESISKYQPASQARTEEAAPAEAPAQQRTELPPQPPRSREPKPAFQHRPAQPIVLPGESIAKYRHAEKAEAPPRAAEHREHEAVMGAAVVAEEIEPQETAVGFAATESMITPAAIAAEHHTEEEITEAVAALPVEESHPAQAEEERRIEGMNVASTFGGDVTEPPQQSAETADSSEDATPNPWYASGRAGVIEEEEIEEDESDLPGFEEHLELAEFDELEEEVLGPVDDQLVPTGGELTDAVRDAHIQERITPFDANSEEGAEGEEFEESVEALGMAGEVEEEEMEVAGEEAAGDLEGARAEERAPAATAGYQQRTGRRPERRGGRRQRPGRPMRGRSRQHMQRALPAISDLLKEGQEILVQIAKEPIAKKGARITSHIALPGRFLVYMPTVHHTGVSRKIASDEERQRLKRIVVSERGEANGGFIVRTAAAGANEDDLRADIRFLINLWNEIKGRAETSKAPALIYHDLNLVERILRDQVTTSFSSIWVDTEQEYERILRFVSRFQPSLIKKVKLYTKEVPLFEQFNITDEINKAMKSKVWLKSGGYIVINQTEALVAIDINTGKYVGKTARLEDTIVKTNIDAIKEIVRQIRLRDLGGIIVIDFIDMDERKNRHRVMQALEEALKADRAPSKVLQFNDFGLVAITRKRVKQSLERTLGQPCPTCSATGMIKSVATVCNEIYVEMRKMRKHFERDIMLRANPEVAKALKAGGGRWLQEMEEVTGQTILVKSDPLLHPEQFDIQ